MNLSDLGVLFGAVSILLALGVGPALVLSVVVVTLLGWAVRKPPRGG